MVDVESPKEDPYAISQGRQEGLSDLLTEIKIRWLLGIGNKSGQTGTKTRTQPTCLITMCQYTQDNIMLKRHTQLPVYTVL